jgi:hypothetical protein
MNFLLTTGMFLLATTFQGQEPATRVHHPPVTLQAPSPCDALSLWTLQGTYAFTATAWQDLSQINPALPGGYAPVSILGTFRLGGDGVVTGWAVINAGGLPMSAEFVNSRFSAPRADCSIPITLSMRITEFGEVVTGPYAYIGVVSGDRSSPEIAFMMLGTGPGSHVELDRARRISGRFE